MGVADAAWLAVWWPWLMVWAVAVLSLLAAVLITVRHWRRDRRFTERHFRGRGGAWYLDQQYVKNFYKVDYYGAASSEDSSEDDIAELTSTISGNAGFFPFFNFGGQRSKKLRRKYKNKSNMSAVLGTLMDDLDKSDEIVYINLHKQEVDANQALGRLVGTPNGKLPDSIRLVDIESWGSFYGRFRVVEMTESAIVLQAPYGSPTNSADAPNVRIRCDRKWLGDATVPEDPFRAHCLGRVQRWESGSGAGYLVVYPVAVFH
jgi:hypothetical protein